ncbi:hypothetical protein MTBBW1_2380032 [Desulfamplus magnetovallimortis]|uniref:Uncharacterized protein n=1 Tax=Desulfamplus magnetovallimortis TaxID=1246637 RepID=A0A1W1HE90_9BACT|nr:hypothetical protein [Desulfamplus magnetovallimortis]SLM30708.1 hypothetical protein MTBBW1_2380032 [Desulfamplus magnetovallimortis]
MDWVSLLKSTIRLGHVYELARTPGSESTSVGEESRFNNATGLFYMVSCRLLEYLQKRDMETPMGFHSITPFYNELVKDFPQFSLADIKFIVNYLSTEIELKFPEASNTAPSENSGHLSAPAIQGNEHTAIQKNEHVAFRGATGVKNRLIKAETPLLEKTRAGYRVRLSANGRTTVNLSYNIEEILYAEQSARKLIRAIEISDFKGFAALSEKLVHELFTKSYEIRILMETTGRDDLRREYERKHGFYNDTLEKVRLTIEELHDTLRDDKTISKIEQFIEENQADSYLVYSLNAKLERINEALLGFQANLSELLKSLLLHTEEFVASVNFMNIAKNILKVGISDRKIESILDLNGAWIPTNSVANPVDIYKPIDLPAGPSEEIPLTFDMQDGEVVVTRLKRFLNQNRDMIVERLDSEKQIPLSEIIKDPLFANDDIEDLTALVGLFINPQPLDIPMVIAIDSEKLSSFDMNGWHIKFNDLVLQRAPEQIDLFEK